MSPRWIHDYKFGIGTYTFLPIYSTTKQYLNLLTLNMLANLKSNLLILVALMGATQSAPLQKRQFDFGNDESSPGGADVGNSADFPPFPSFDKGSGFNLPSFDSAESSNSKPTGSNAFSEPFNDIEKSHDAFFAQAFKEKNDAFLAKQAARGIGGSSFVGAGSNPSERPARRGARITVKGGTSTVGGKTYTLRDDEVRTF
jgi:hypothetical protein